jgi:hypothetical protein
VEQKQNALVRYSEMAHLNPNVRTTAQIIRDLCSTAFDDDPFFDDISPYLIPEGVSGSRQGDHVLIAEKLFNHHEVGNKLKGFANLSHMMLWRHAEVVLRKRGYTFS